MKTEMKICKTEMDMVFFYAETETKTEWCFPVEHMWKRNFLFLLIWNFRFYYRPMAAL